jgi:hypothetical protein
MATFKLLSAQEAPATVARMLYGSALDATERAEVKSCMRDFDQLPTSERLYILCHLEYLNLMAQQQTQNFLMNIENRLSGIEQAAYSRSESPLYPPDWMGMMPGGIPSSDDRMEFRTVSSTPFIPTHDELDEPEQVTSSGVERAWYEEPPEGEVIEDISRSDALSTKEVSVPIPPPNPGSSILAAALEIPSQPTPNRKERTSRSRRNSPQPAKDSESETTQEVHHEE